MTEFLNSNLPRRKITIRIPFLNLLLLISSYFISLISILLKRDLYITPNRVRKLYLDTSFSDIEINANKDYFYFKA